MKIAFRSKLALAAWGLALLLAPAAVGRSPDAQQRVAALKQSLARDKQQIRQYEWIETTVISLKGEEKARRQKQCYYGADGALQKVELSEPRFNFMVRVLPEFGARSRTQGLTFVVGVGKTF